MTSSAPSLKPSAEFLRFAVAGAMGFAVDAGLLLAFTGQLGWQPLLARLASFAIAVGCTWAINRAWTFRAGRKSVAGVGAEFATYGVVQLTGFAVNFGVYAVVISLIGNAPAQLMIATACGSAAGLVVNYLGARRFVFRRSA
jgi:putative flippase GtrA